MLLTPPGSGAIAVVRLAGDGVGEFLARHFSRRPEAGRCVYGVLADGERVIDDGVVVLGTDGTFADVNLHGGSWVVRSLLELARRSGFEVIENAPGPLPPVAVDGESPIERDVLTHLPMARTELAVRTLLAQPAAWRGGPLDAEVMLADWGLHWLLNPPQVAIIGAPNVGKSTLANQLFAQERSITADLPGTTRDWVGEIANIDGLAVMLLDTPGLRETEDAIERQAIERSAEEIRRSRLVIVVLDATRSLEEGQRQLLEAYPQALRVVNKVDRLAAWDAATVGGLATVATSGGGMDVLRRAIQRHFGCEEIEPTRPRWWTEGQRELLRRGVEEINAYMREVK